MNHHETNGKSAVFDAITVLIKYLLLSLVLPLSMESKADHPTDDKEDKDETALVYEEIPVRVFVEGYHSFYLNALYTSNKALYIDISELFSLLHISCQPGKKANTLTGFTGNDNQPYVIDYEKKSIKVGNLTLPTATGLIKVKDILYLESTLLNESFGISLLFNYRALTLQLKTRFELPQTRQQRIQKMRDNLFRIKGEAPADTVLQRSYHLMKFGTLDWAIAATQAENTFRRNQFKLALGTELLYGEADLTVNYDDHQKFDNRQLSYLWHWADNNNPIIKQIQSGILPLQPISYINAPVIGATVRNTPTTLRKATGYYTLNEYTAPNRDVELYINNVLVDYTKSDASGLYHFKVPNVYGYTTLKLKFYGPMGEEKTIERTVNIPYTLMPVKTFEYALSAGIAEDSSSSRFARADLSYGLNRFVTIGGGVEYLSSITTGSKIPFLKATLQPFSKLTLNGEYAHGVRTKGAINYYLQKDIFLEVEYTRYVEGQKATFMNASDERKVRLSAPYNLKKVRGFVRFDYMHLGYRTLKYNQANIQLSAYYKLFSANTSTQINWINPQRPFILTDLVLYYRFKNGLTLSPSTQYDVRNKSLTTFKIGLEKYFTKGDFSVSYERRISMQTGIINLNFRYDLKFARTGFSVTQQKALKNNTENPNSGTTVITENIQGSLAFGRGNNYLHKSNNPSVGRGGISFYPFLDLNQNGKFDKGETMVRISPLSIKGNKIVTEKDSILSLTDLLPFTWYTIAFKETDPENFAWRFPKSSYRIMVDPNQFKRVDVPVVPVNTVSGIIFAKQNDQITRTGKIAVTVYDTKSNRKIAETLSETDGYYTITGLAPGAYIARTDSIQLNNLHYQASPKEQPFMIRSLKEGDQVSKTDFILTPVVPDKPPDTQAIAPPSELPLSKLTAITDQSGMYYPSKPFDLNRLLFHSRNPIRMFKSDTVIYLKRTLLYAVQLYTSHQPIDPEDTFTQLIAKVPGIKIMEMKGKDGLYHYSTGVFLDSDQAGEYIAYIRQKGWIFGYVDIYSGGKRKVITFR